MESVVVLVLLAAVILLLATERIRSDLVAMLALAALILLRVLTPEQALSGFSNPATVAVACMFVLSAGLRSSGVVQFLGDRLLKSGPSSPGRLLLVCALVVGPVSAFISNTAAVAVFLPVVVRACHGNGVSPSRILMPLSFFAMLGGMCTLIGTSTNILVSSLAAQHDIPPFGMFEFSRLGLVMFVAGLGYLLLGRRILPERVQPESLTEGFHLNRYLSEAVVLPGSNLAGKTLHEARLGERFDLEVLRLIRADGRTTGTATEEDRLEEGDLLLVKAPAAALVRMRDRAGIGIKPGRHPNDAALRSADSVLTEAVIPPNSRLDGRTLKGVDFRHRYGATALAIRRHGEDIREKIGKVRLQLGDELLILASLHNMERLRKGSDLLVLEEVDIPVIEPVRAVTSILIVAAVVATAALEPFGLRIAEAAVIGSVLMATTGCLPVRKLYEAIDWRVIFLLAGLIPMGLALEASGAAHSAVTGMLWLMQDWGATAFLGAFFLSALLLTGFMSNAATAALLAPLAITCARALEVSPRPFLMALAFAASAAFYTPIGYQTNLLVYGPGGYRFTDFVRAGGPLSLLILIVATLLIPVLFPF